MEKQNENGYARPRVDSRTYSESMEVRSDTVDGARQIKRQSSRKLATPIALYISRNEGWRRCLPGCVPDTWRLQQLSLFPQYGLLSCGRQYKS